ncbi:hypothetical protein F444_14208 [Phytophthora nicotianae P1976]|uniref:HAT C-terminal dimerisation domain-containing protein n=1 Tax=Phytophthora nicotianae P1976 TaxID=1317066 RepID=A0A080ZR59_PHYNI|nr:hypothetical protein F444_14208 [Phytophthora nicotianae P1976]
MFDPIIEALRALEADSGFISGVYQWFRWLRYHTAYGVTSPDGEQSQAELAESDLEQESHDQDGAGIGVLSDAAEILSSTFLTENQQQNVTASNLDSRDDDEYTSITTISLDELQTFFREKIQKRWKYVHTNAMAVAFLLDPATNLDDFVGDDDENVDDQVCKLAIRCGMITPANVAKLTAEILKFKCMKRRGGEELRRKYSEACPRDYWGAKDEKNYPLLKMVAAIVFAIPTSSAASERAWSIFDHIHSKRRNRLSVEKIEMLAYIYINYGTIRSGEIDLARHQSRPESVDIDHEF